MRKLLIVFTVLLAITPFTFAMATPQSTGANTDDIMSAFQEYCIGSLKSQQDVGAYATQKNLKEYSAQDALKFSPDGGRVFDLPTLHGVGVLTTNKNFDSVCSIAIHKTDIQSYRTAIYKYFSSINKYSLTKEQRNDQEKVTRSEFLGEIGRPVKVIISTSDIQRPNGIQILMTIGRVDDPQKP